MDVSQRACQAGKSELSGADNIWMELPWRCNEDQQLDVEVLMNACQARQNVWKQHGWALKQRTEVLGCWRNLVEEEEGAWCKATPEVRLGLWAWRSYLETFFFFPLGGLCAVTQQTIGRTRRGSLGVSGNCDTCIIVSIACYKHSQKTKLLKWQE